MTDTLMHTLAECRAQDPATCKYHGNPLHELQLNDEGAFNRALDELLDDEEETTPSYQHTVSFPSEELEKAEKIIERANRRLERAGIDDRFTYLIETEIREVDGQHIEYTNLVLNTPEIKISGYSFVAAHEFTPNGKATSHYVTEEALRSTREIDQRCEHCGSNRHRQRVYWVKDDKGEIKQIGSSCLKEFFGVKPNGLWALDGKLDFSGLGGGIGNSAVYPSRDLIAAGIAASEARGFVTRGAAYGTNRSTADDVMTRWPDYSGSVENATYAAQADEVLNWARNLPEDRENAYMNNLRIAASDPWVKRKHVPLVMSAIKTYKSQQERARWEAEREAARLARQAADAQLQQSYYAAPGEKVVDVPVKVVASKYFPNDFGGMTMYTFETEDGHRLKWNSHNGVDLEKDSEVVLASARVKDNTIYNDVYQTVISHVKVANSEN